MPINRKLQHLENYVDTKNLKDDSVLDSKLGPLVEKMMPFLFTGGDGISDNSDVVVLTALDGSAQALPDNAIISKYTIDVTTPLAGNSSTVAFGCVTDGAAMIKAATAFNHASLVAATQVTALPVLSKKLTAARNVIGTIAGADMTAGVLVLYITYFEGQ
tara:strand:- start:53 stop:532 length:480 start_codon:yes stop_codon:yes gene_type:complete